MSMINCCIPNLSGVFSNYHPHDIPLRLRPLRPMLVKPTAETVFSVSCKESENSLRSVHEYNNTIAVCAKTVRHRKIRKDVVGRMGSRELGC